MKKIFRVTIITVFVFVIKIASAQNSYINHTLKQGENLSALAKQYNTNVGDIMRLNNMHADTKLVFGSVIKIPSKKNIQTATEITKPVSVQLTATDANATKHTVSKGETLYSISKQYNVSTDDLKAWNKLSDNNVKPGNVLIVIANNTAEAVTPVAEIKRQRVETTEENKTLPVMQTEQKNKVENSLVEEKVADNSNQEINTANANVSVDNNESSSAQWHSNDGYFANSYKKNKRQQHVTGISKTFKTASGWNDGKYYVLADDINPGTVVKLTADNGASVYAKVLWNMGDLKENNGINFRISNATAAALSENSASFNLDIYY